MTDATGPRPGSRYRETDLRLYRIDPFIGKNHVGIFTPLAKKVVADAVSKIPDDAELGEKLIDICILVLEKAVKLTKTTADDKLLEAVKAALVTRDGE